MSRKFRVRCRTKCWENSDWDVGQNVEKIQIEMSDKMLRKFRLRCRTKCWENSEWDVGQNVEKIQSEMSDKMLRKFRVRCRTKCWENSEWDIRQNFDIILSETYQKKYEKIHRQFLEKCRDNSPACGQQNIGIIDGKTPENKYRDNWPWACVARRVRGRATNVSIRIGASGASAEIRIRNLQNMSEVLPLETTHSVQQVRQRTYNGTLRHGLATILQCNSNCIPYCVRVFVCVCLWPEVCRMQYTCAVLSSVACPARQYFPTSHKVHDIRKEVIEHKKCLDFPYKFL